MVVVDPKYVARTERLLIRPLVMQDAEDVLLMRSNAEVMKHASILPSTSLAECKTWIQGCFDWPINWNFAIELLPSSSSTISPSPCQDGPRVIGLIGAVRAPEIGYMLNYNYWGKGYATEALRAFMPMFFDWYSGGKQGRFEFAEAFTDTELVASQHILEKVGFRFVEKREKDFENPVLGLRDTLVYRMDRPDAAVDVAHMRS